MSNAYVLWKRIRCLHTFYLFEELAGRTGMGGELFPGQHRGHRKFRVEGAEHQAISFQQGHGALNGKGNRNALVHQGGDVGNDIIGGKEIQLGKRHAKPGLQFPLDGAAVGGDEGERDQILPYNVGFARQRVV